MNNKKLKPFQVECSKCKYESIIWVPNFKNQKCSKCVGLFKLIENE